MTLDEYFDDWEDPYADIVGGEDTYNYYEDYDDFYCDYDDWDNWDDDEEPRLDYHEYM